MMDLDEFPFFTLPVDVCVPHYGRVPEIEDANQKLLVIDYANAVLKGTERPSLDIKWPSPITPQALSRWIEEGFINHIMEDNDIQAGLESMFEEKLSVDAAVATNMHNILTSAKTTAVVVNEYLSPLRKDMVMYIVSLRTQGRRAPRRLEQMLGVGQHLTRVVAQHIFYETKELVKNEVGRG